MLHRLHAWWAREQVASANAAEAANLLEELTDEHEARQDWEEDLRDPQAWWKRKIRKVWEATKTVASLALVLAFGWGIYDQYPASRDFINGLAGIIVILVLFSIPGIISRARRRRRCRREFIRRELATIKEALDERYGGLCPSIDRTEGSRA
jgi:hypothetical protein